MIVAELLAKFGLQTDQASFDHADNSLKGMIQHAEHFAHVFLGALGAHALFEFVEDLAHVGSEINKTSLKLGIATDALQEYRFAASQADVDQSELETGFRFLSRSAFDAANGGKEAAAMYSKLGVSVKDASGNVRPIEDLFADVADGLAGTENETERAALAMKVFGRSGTALIPLLKDGAEGIEALRQEARELGGGFDEHFIHQAHEFHDALDKLNFSFLAFKNTLGHALFPVFEAGINKLTKWSKMLQEVLRGSRFLEIGLTGLAAVSVVAGVRALIPWLPFLFSFLAIAAAITATIAVIDDIHALLTGGKSLVGKYIDEWLGIGAADQLVRQWSEGIDILINSVKSLLEFKNPLDAFIGMFKGAFDIGSVLGNESARQDHIKETEAKIAELRKNAPGGKSPIADALDRELSLVRGERTSKRGIAAPLALDKSIPRTEGRGIQAPLAEGSAGFGQAAPDAVHPLLRPSAVQGHGESAASAVEQHNNIHVEVHAKTEASAEEIGRHAKKHVSEALAGQNRNLRRAMVNRPAESTE